MLNNIKNVRKIKRLIIIQIPALNVHYLFRPPEFVDLVTRCLSVEQTSRPLAQQILDHQFFGTIEKGDKVYIVV